MISSQREHDFEDEIFVMHGIVADLDMLSIEDVDYVDSALFDLLQCIRRIKKMLKTVNEER